MTNNSKKAAILQLTDSYSFRLCCFHPFQKELCNNDHFIFMAFMCWEEDGANLNAQIIEKDMEKGPFENKIQDGKSMNAWICLAIHCFDGLSLLFGRFDHCAGGQIHGRVHNSAPENPWLHQKNSQDLAIPSKLSSIMVAPNLTNKCYRYSYLFSFVVWLFGMFHSGTGADG